MNCNAAGTLEFWKQMSEGGGQKWSLHM